MVCDKVVCERLVVWQRLYVTKLCVKDGVWQSCVCVDITGVWQRWYVTKLVVCDREVCVCDKVVCDKEMCVNVKDGVC